VKDGLTLDNTGNNVIAPFTQNGFRQALQYLSGLRRDGLLEPSLFTNNQQEYRATLAANPSVVGFVTAGSVGNWVDWTRDPAILRSQTNAYVSAGLYPSITVVETSLVWNNPNKTIWGNPGPRYASEQQGNTRGSTTRPFLPNSAVAILDAYNYQWYVPSHPRYIIPSLKYTLPEAQRIGVAITVIRDYVNQSLAEFTTGARDINNDTVWNAYLRELDNMGLRDWLTTAQAAFNRTK